MPDPAPPADPATAPPRRRRWAAGAVVVAAGLLVAAGAVVWFVFVPKAPDAATAAALARTHNLALGALEAADPVAADPLLVELSEAGRGLTDESGVSRVAARNLAVGRVLAVDPEAGGNVPPAERADWLPRAKEAVARLKELEPDDPAADWLAARLAVAEREPTERVSALARARSHGPPAAWVLMAQWEAMKASPDPATRAAATTALAAAAAAAPENVWVLLNAAKAFADDESPRTVEAFAALRERLSPFAEGFRYRQNGGVPALIDAGEAAAAAGDWAAARRNAALLFNVVRSEEVARADRLDLERHPLDFVATDFPPAFYESAGLDRVADPAAVPVEYVPLTGDAAPPDVPVLDAAATNFDLLGGLELVLLTDDAVRVFARDAGGPWAETVRYDLPESGAYTGIVTADLDLDSDEAPRDAAGREGPAVGCHKADPDLMLWGPTAGVLVLENRLNADGSRSLVPAPDGEELAAVAGVRTAAAVDLDQEGDLDLLLLTAAGPRLWFNRGNFTFEDRTERSDLRAPAPAVADLIAVDLDRDVDLDVVLGAAGASFPAAVLENLRHGEFRLDAAPGALGIELLDADGNASWDLATADGRGVTLTTSVTPAPGRMRWDEPETIFTGPVDRLRAVDHDNDGRVDLLAWGADGVHLLRNAAGGWEDASDRLPETAAPAEFRPHDFDLDGDLDLLVLAGGKPAIWENRGGEANGSLSVALLAEFDKDGTDPKRCNHAGLGSLLELKRGPVYQPAVVRDRATHFGLGPIGEHDAGEVLRVLWTNGIPEVVLNPESGALCHPQKLGGSCPYLYAWDGERFAFATDLCWAAPVGLQLAEGVFAPTRAWEHVLLPGDSLKPRADRYELRVTCELWEADYFDRLELTCVDHPPGTHVFTNEKVGPPDLTEPHLYAARTLHAPAAARVRSGEGDWRDVLNTVAERDEDFLKPFAAKITQGYTEPWELELDLAGAPREGAVLLLTGWVFPTDTGLNVALSQNPALAGPRPPALSVETADGWAEVFPKAGFPGGKTKTIALPLPAFPTDSRRVRLAGTQELYWDRAAWCDPAAGGGVEVVSTAAPLAAADLRYRGFSARSWPESGNGPDRFDYGDVSEEAAWPLMAGPFTRYGDVRELLTEADDRQAVLGSGDEIAVSFRVPPRPGAPGGPPAGWVRDFVVSSIGYDKDANLHTAHGQGVLPLPHAGMTQYPPPPDRPFPDTPELRAYQEDYQTRPADHRRFWRAVRDAANADPTEPAR